MGLFNLISTSTVEQPVESPRPAGNPNPHRFTVVKKERFGGFVSVMVRYPDCSNYEGKKVLVMPCKELADALASGVLDPHFTDDGRGPVARLEPTKRGWKMATRVAIMLDLAEV